MNGQREVRVGVVGCGVMGKIHAKVAQASEGIVLQAVADVRQEVAQQVAQEHGARQAYGDPAALFADPEVDAVVLALPTNLRTPLALAALKAGKHLLLEKPVAVNAAQVREMMALQGDRIVGVCSCRYQFYQSAQVAAQAVARGELGQLRVVQFRGMNKDRGPKQGAIPAWRVSHQLNGGGFWVNWGCYDLDFILSTCGWNIRPRTVLAQCWPIADHLPNRVAEGSDAEEHAIVFIRCDNGIVLSLERGESLSIDVPSTWQIIGSKASLRLEMLQREKNPVILDRTHADGPVTTEVLWEGDNDRECVHQGPLQDLCAAIRTGGQPRTNLQRALVMQQITDAVYESARTGKAVEIA